MPDLPISSLPNLTGATNDTLVAVVYSGVSGNTTYQINLQDLIRSKPLKLMAK